jgi:hypothetical protein
MLFRDDKSFFEISTQKEGDNTMRIVSQDRTCSVDFGNGIIHIIRNSIEFLSENRGVILGNYKSQERAREVFEDIHNAYAPVYSVSDNLSNEEIQSFIGSQNVVAKNIILPKVNGGISITTYDTFVYCMPEE